MGRLSFCSHTEARESHILDRSDSRESSRTTCKLCQHNYYFTEPRVRCDREDGASSRGGGRYDETPTTTTTPKNSIWDDINLILSLRTYLFVNKMESTRCRLEIEQSINQRRPRNLPAHGTLVAPAVLLPAVLPP